MMLPKYVISEVTVDGFGNVRFKSIDLNKLMANENLIHVEESFVHEDDTTIWCDNCQSMWYKDEDAGDVIKESKYCPECGVRWKRIKVG